MLRLFVLTGIVLAAAVAVFVTWPTEGYGDGLLWDVKAKTDSFVRSDPPRAVDGNQERSSGLRFVPTTTSDTALSKIKAEVAGLGLKGFGGRSIDDSFYLLIGRCGGSQAASG